MAVTRLPTDLQVVGELSCQTFAPSLSCIGDAAFKSSDPLTAEKQQHRWIRQLTQVHGTAGVSERRVVHCARGSGVIDLVRAGVVVANVGAATITVDVRKNGTTVLSAVISLGSADAAYAKKSGTITVPAYAAGDVLEVVIVATAGGGTLGQGLFVDVVLTEAASRLVFEFERSVCDGKPGAETEERTIEVPRGQSRKAGGGDGSGSDASRRSGPTRRADRRGGGGLGSDRSGNGISWLPGSRRSWHLAAYCLAVGDMLAARNEINSAGRFLKVPVQNFRGESLGFTVKEHPACKMLDRASTRVQKLGAELGLTPAARDRVEGSGPVEAPKDNAFVAIRERIQAARNGERTS